MVKRFWVLWAALLVLPLLGLATPQAGQGEIKGRVTDPQGKAVPGTTVIFVGATNGKSQQATTDQNGEFSIVNVEPGKYTLQSSTGQTITTGTQVNVDSTGASNNYHVNGTDNNNQLAPGPLVTVTNEATTDFTLMQGQQLPQFGHNAGGQMNSVLADGSNKWHGGVYDYFNNRKLNAVEPVLRGQRIMRYDQNRLGGKAGGPVWKNNVFAFANFEYIPLRTEQPFLNPAFAPTAEGFATLTVTPGVSAANLAALQNNVQVSQTTLATATVQGRTIPLGLVNSGLRIHQNQ